MWLIFILISLDLLKKYFLIDVEKISNRQKTGNKCIPFYRFNIKSFCVTFDYIKYPERKPIKLSILIFLITKMRLFINQFVIFLLIFWTCNSLPNFTNEGQKSQSKIYSNDKMNKNRYYNNFIKMLFISFDISCRLNWGFGFAANSN